MGRIVKEEPMPTPPRRTPASTARAPAVKPRAAPAAQAVSQTVADAKVVRAVRAKRARALLGSLAQRKVRIGTEFYEMGRELAELSDGKYYVDLDYPTFAAMVEDGGLLAREVAWRLIAVFRSIPRNTARQLGPQKSIEWLRLLRTVAGPDATEQQLNAAARGPAVVQGTPVADLSTRQLVELRRRTAERRALGRKDPGATDAHKLARALAQLLRRHGAEDANVTARYARAWRIRIDLGLDAGRGLRKVLEQR
jgi:hypothetical protein